MVVTGKRPLEDGLIFAFLLSEGAGVTLHDVSGNRHHGTLANGPSWTTDPAIDYDDTANHVTTLGAHADYNPAACSFFVRAYIDKDQGRLSDFSRLLELGAGIRIMFTTSTNTLRNAPTLVSGGKYTIFHVIAANGWYDIAGYVDATGGNLFVNGVKESEDAWGADPISYTNEVGRIACDITYGHRWWGEISQIFVWNRVLSDEEFILMSTQRRRI